MHGGVYRAHRLYLPMITTGRTLSVCHLWAWEPNCRMLPGQFPNELRVLIPDAGATPVDFHDIIMSDLRATPEWRARRIVPSDITSLRRRWPKILFATMHKRQADMENLHRSCRHRPERAFSNGHLAIAPSVRST